MRYSIPSRSCPILPIGCLLVALAATTLLMGCGSSSAAGTITTVAGNGTSGFTGEGGPAVDAELSQPRGVATDSAGNFYIADTNNSVIRKVSASSTAINVVAGNRTPGFDNTDGMVATSAELNRPTGVAVDSSGNIYIADFLNNRVREVPVSTGIITTVAGNGTVGYSGDGGPATSATLNGPFSVAVDSSGNLYIADRGNNVIRKVDASSGVITTVAGNATVPPGYSGDGGAATAATLNSPYGVGVDSSANIYIADTNNNVIRKVTSSSGTITTIAGNGTAGATGSNGLATSAELNSPFGVALDSSANVYIADRTNMEVRKVTASSGIITTVAGDGVAGYAGDHGSSTSAELNSPNGVAVNSSGNLYIADSGNNVIRMVLF
jgi:trimeric autotransporter adhesin